MTENPGALKESGLTILHVYAGNLYGGIESLLTTLARSRDIQPSLAMEFALCFPGRLLDELRDAGAVVHELGAVRFRHPWSLLQARRRMARLLTGGRFDAVVTHACWPHAVLAPVARRAGIPVIFWQHDFAGRKHWIERMASRTRPDMVLSNSRASASTLGALFPGLPSEILHCPVSPGALADEPESDRAEIRRSLGTPDDAVVIIQACRMEPWKGHANLVDALRRLSDQPDWFAWIVGGDQRAHESGYLARLKAQVESAGIGERVQFLGQRSDVRRLLRAADLHCQPNTEPEPFGIAFVEALHAGLPIVTTRIGGALEIITADCGVLVEPGDSAALAVALRRLIEDPAERKRLGRGGSGRAEMLCDPGRILNRFYRLISGMVDDSASMTRTKG